MMQQHTPNKNLEIKVFTSRTSILVSSFLVVALLSSLFIYPSKTYARSILCPLSIKNNLWPKAPFFTDILNLQRYLNSKNYAVPISGVYEQKTKDAVRAFQKDRSMQENQSVGFITRNLINQDICNDTGQVFDGRYTVTYSPQLTDQDFVFLDVPLIEQSYRLSCEAASVEMILKYRGIQKNQTQILQEIGNAKPFLPRMQGRTMIWGDPDTGFVGDVTGYIYPAPLGLKGATGWGVNNGPVARMIEKYLPGTKEIDGTTLSQIKTHLKENKPVIFWQREDEVVQDTLTYKTPENKTVLFGVTHVAVLVGYRVDSAGKVTYFVNDPATGRKIVDEATLDRSMARYGYNAVLVE